MTTKKQLIEKWKVKAQNGLSWKQTEDLIKEAIKVGQESFIEENTDGETIKGITEQAIKTERDKTKKLLKIIQNQCIKIF